MKTAWNRGYVEDDKAEVIYVKLASAESLEEVLERYKKADRVNQ